MMTPADLLDLADRYGAAAGLTRRQVSWRIFADTKKLDALAQGGDLTTGRYHDALAAFAETWPADLAWPDGIARPPQAQGAAVVVGGDEGRPGVPASEAEPKLKGGAEIQHDGESAADAAHGHVKSDGSAAPGAVA
ncbi:hypothetical protein NPA31_007315 [Aurantimonas sp. MSK8Z-1]|nr:hypothetical protein [Aurantimonas sp. MSK8Z-1]